MIATSRVYLDLPFRQTTLDLAQQKVAGLATHPNVSVNRARKFHETISVCLNVG